MDLGSSPLSAIGRVRSKIHLKPAFAESFIGGALAKLETSRVLVTSEHSAFSLKASRHQSGEGQQGVQCSSLKACQVSGFWSLTTTNLSRKHLTGLCPELTTSKTKQSRRMTAKVASGTAGVEPENQNEDDEDDDDGIRFPLLQNLPYLVLRRVRKYFRDNPWRRALFGGISLFLGFYIAQTVSLTLGALSLNDVIAAALCVVFTEAVTKYYHTRNRPTFPQALLNVFKMGFTYGLMIDAFKLAS